MWVEIQFYVVIGLIYFINKKNFIRNFIVISVFLSGLFYISHDTNLLPIKVEWFTRVVLEIFNFSKHALWFVIGVLIYKLYFGGKDYKIFITTLLVIVLQLIFTNFATHIMLFTILCVFIFYSFLYNQKLLKFLTGSIIQKIGIASYSIYLIHQNIGILIINKFHLIFGKANFILPILITIIFCSAGLIIYKYFEKPFGNYLRNKLIS